MSVTYIAVAKPGELRKPVNLQYMAYVGKLAGFRTAPDEVLKEFKISTLGQEASKHISGLVATLNSTTFHSDKVYFIVDLGYKLLDDLVAEINADVCSVKWRWVSQWLAELTKLMGVDDYEVVGFRNIPVQVLIFDRGAQAIRKTFITELVPV